VTGAAVFQLVPALDAGDVFAQLEYAVPRGATAGDVLDALAEVAILQRAVAEADAPHRHAVTLTLTRATPAELLRDGPSAPDGGLFEQLSLAYASARGVVEEAVVLTDAGARIESRGGDLLHDAARLAGVCAVTLRISGLCVWDFFRHEQGTHVWRTLAGVPEVVRVTAAHEAHTGPSGVMKPPAVLVLKSSRNCTLARGGDRVKAAPPSTKKAT
jgi:hypothetical protein